MADHHAHVPTYQPVKNDDDNSFYYEMYYEELQAKSHSLSCCYVRLLIKYPNHPEKDTWEKRSNYWLNYYRKLSYMEPPIETTFKVYEAIGSFAAEYLMVSELEKKLRLTQV